MSDTELVARFGSVQYNVHRGELQEALLNVRLLVCGCAMPDITVFAPLRFSSGKEDKS